MQRPKPSMNPTIADEAPVAAELCDYDYTMLVVYVRLLDAAAQGADWREVARALLKVDPDQEPVRAWRMHETHLARARWMTTQGYRELLREGSL
jgi:hypothetical protein